MFATHHEGDRLAIEAVETAFVEIPHVVDAQRLFGGMGYLPRVSTQDFPAFQQPCDESLSTLANVQRLTSTPVMKRGVWDSSLPGEGDGQRQK